MSVDYSLPPAARKSAALHQRVRNFARAQFASLTAPKVESDTFEGLALDIARFQYEFNAGFARCVVMRGGRLDSLDDLPLVPTDAFRFTRVAAHPRDLDQAVFRSSGTTSDHTSTHPVRDLTTKKVLSLLQAEESLFHEFKRGIVVAIAPTPEEPASSSLGHMMELFMCHFDGRGLASDPRGVPFHSRETGRWLVGPTGIDLHSLGRAARLAIHRSEPLFVLSTSFALMATLEALDGQVLKMPSRTVLMLTGGFKGRSHELDEKALRKAAAQLFHTTEERIYGEYGMTELSSQLFQDPQSGLYLAPPWLRVRIVSASDHSLVKEGEAGLAHFIDLANVDSCLSVVTQDLIRKKDNGFELLGRAPRAIARGCSLPFEGLLSMNASASIRRNPSSPMRLARSPRRPR